MGTTADRLRAAAEELLVEQGQAATTLRDITDRAGANVAAVSYHFGSKDALLSEVFRDALTEVTQVQLGHVEALPPDADLEDLVRVWLAPALHERDRDSRETRLWALIQRGMAEQAPGLLEHLPAIRDVVETHLITRLAQALPHLPREELLLRHAAVLAAIAVIGRGDLDVVAAPAADQADLVVAWVVGSLRAPSGRRA